MLFIITILPITHIVIAGDEGDPEIVDPEGDLVGILINFPQFFKILTTIKILDIEHLDFLDVLSAWFYEREIEPDYLFTSIKFKDLDLPNNRVIYSMYWNYDDSDYAVTVHIQDNGEIHIFSTYIDSLGVQYEIDGSIDKENNIITFKIPKDYIGDPKPGDILTNTNAWAGLRFSKETLFTAVIGELAKDWTEYGRDYVIQY
jgi:hypothetical protein